MLGRELYIIQSLLTRSLTICLHSAAGPALLQGDFSPYDKPVLCQQNNASCTNLGVIK